MGITSQDGAKGREEAVRMCRLNLSSSSYLPRLVRPIIKLAQDLC
jgi:hypothetical protein